MAIDLIFGRTRRNWSRGAIPSSLITVAIQTQITDELDFKLSPAEMTALADLSATQMLAQGGDREAKKKLARLGKEMAKLKARAARGDAKAKRTLRVFEESGLFRGTQSFSLGEESEITNTKYRACVLKQARKSAQVSGRSTPTTKDFFLAKKAVDKTMSESGISLYLPGSTPGRVTY